MKRFTHSTLKMPRLKCFGLFGGIFMFALLLLSPVRVYAQAPGNIKPAFGGATTQGNEFWVGFLDDNNVDSKNTSLQLEIIITAREATSVDVECNGRLLGTMNVGANGWDTLQLPAATVYPQQSEYQAGNPMKKGIRVYSKNKKTFSCFAYEGVGTSGGISRDVALVYPLHVLGDEYRVQTYPNETKSTQFNVVATEDGTTVRVTPSCPTLFGGPGAPVEKILNKGEMLLIASKPAAEQGAINVDLSGSIVCANNPVAVFVGNQAMKEPLDNSLSANFGYEQILPLENWGTDFYLGLAQNTKQNQFVVTASQETEVQISTSFGTQTMLLAPGQSTPIQYLTSDGATNAVVHASAPVVCYTYRSNGAVNQTSTFDPLTAKPTQVMWGNSTSAMIPHRLQAVDTMDFAIKGLVSNDASHIAYSVQVSMLKSESNTLSLDGNPVPSNLFRTYDGDPNMVYVNIPVESNGRHEVACSGKGFTGFVEAIGSGQTYTYTLGFRPHPERDSLFLSSKENVKIASSYEQDELPYGYYQRQTDDWPVGKERLDTIYVCDSSRVQLLTHLSPRSNSDRVRWILYPYNNRDKMVERDSVEIYSDHHFSILSDADLSRPIREQNKETKEWEDGYTFTLDPQLDKKPSERNRYQLFQLQALVYHGHELCADLSEDVDTLKMMVHVSRAYRDTIAKRVICDGDTIEAFMDSGEKDHDYYLLGEEGDRKATKFMPNPTNKWEEKYEVGDNLLIHHYQSVLGCDSIMMFYLHVCEPVIIDLDTVICEDEPLVYRGVKLPFHETGKFESKSKTHECDFYKSIDPTFQGCDSIINVNLEVVDTFYRYQKVALCMDKVTDDNPYVWTYTFPDGTVVYPNGTAANPFKITRDMLKPSKFQGDMVLEYHGFFYDSLTIKRKDYALCDSVYELDFTLVNNQTRETRVSICENSKYYYSPLGKLFTPDKDTMPVRKEPYEYIMYVEVSEGCAYEDHLFIKVNPAYPEGQLVVYDTICQAPGAYYDISRWKKGGVDEMEGRILYNFTTTDHSKTIDPEKISIGKDGKYTFVDSTRTRACPECQGGGGCDSIMTLHLCVLPSYNITETWTISEEEMYSWQGLNFAGEKSVWKNVSGYEMLKSPVVRQDTIYERKVHHNTKKIGTHSCDSIYNLQLKVGKVFRDTTFDFTCDNDLYVWEHNGKSYLPQKDTLIMDKHHTVLGYDSIYYLKLYVYPTYNFPLETAVVCQSDEGYTWLKHESLNDGNPFSTMRDTIYMILDKQKTKTLFTDSSKVKKVPEENMVPTVIRRNPTFLEQISEEDDVQYEQYPTECDSIHSLKLIVLPTYNAQFHTAEVTDKRSLCDNDTIIWERHLYVGGHFEEFFGPLPASMPGIDQIHYVLNDTTDFRSFTNQVAAFYGKNCDSIRFLDLRVGSIQVDTIQRTICNRENYVFGDARFPGHEKVFEWDHHYWGKDSTAFKTDTVVWVSDTLQSVSGCDSISVLKLTVHPTYAITTDTMFCNSTLTEFNWRGRTDYHITYSSDSLVIITDSIREESLVTGCDSMFYLKLTVQPSFRKDYFISTCQGDTVDFYTDKIYDIVPWTTEPGLLFPNTAKAEATTEISEGGCDNKAVANVTFYRRYLIRDSVFVCDDESYTWHRANGDTVLHPLPGNGYETYYEYLKTKAYSYSCDSIRQFMLYHSSTYDFKHEDAVCLNSPYIWDTHENRTLFCKTDGRYYDHVPTDRVGFFEYEDRWESYMHCDSIWTLQLTVLPSYDIHIDTILCTNSTINWNGMEFKGVLDGGTLDVGDDFEKTVSLTTKVGGCDSIVTLHVKVAGINNVEITAQICDNHPYPFCGYYVNKTGDYCDTIPNMYGCDSIVKLHLTAYPSYAFYQDTLNVMCSTEQIVWPQNGKTYRSDSATVIRDTINYQTINGCDSTYYFAVHVNQAYFWHQYDTICGEELFYEWEGHNQSYEIDLKDALGWTKDTTFIYYDYQTSIQGCDSNYIMELNVRPIEYSTTVDTMCVGDYYTTSSGAVYTETGVYNDTITNQWGCHVITTIYLTMLPPTKYQLNVPRICADQKSFDLGFTYEGKRPIAYTVYFDSLAVRDSHPQFVTQSDVIGRNDNAITIDMPYHEDSLDYPRPDYYHATLYMDNGYCVDTALIRFPFDFTISYPSWLTEQHWHDAIVILNSKYNGGYAFSSYQWYRNDSMLIGATLPYLYEPHYLNTNAEYYVMLVRENEENEFPTCPIIPTANVVDQLTPTMGYVSVVPTYVLQANPVVNILSRYPGSYQVFTTFGEMVEQGRFVPDEHYAYEIRLPGNPGVYIFKMRDDEGLDRTVKVIVQ